MPEYIEREALLKRNMFGNTNPITHRTYAKNLIESAPAADVVEVKHGEWIEHFNFGCWHYDCPFCDFGFATQIRNEDTPNYCENCGAKMDKKEGADNA